MNHTEYKLSKQLKEFFGKDAPEPIIYQGYTESGSFIDADSNLTYLIVYPAYSLEDILSRPFCIAIDLRIPGAKARDIAKQLFSAYYDDGFPAVEAEIAKLIGGEECKNCGGYGTIPMGYLKTSCPICKGKGKI